MQIGPPVTIVTVVRNDEKNIEKTILSVLSQDYHSIEYILIDGASTDQTSAVIKRYADKISKHISEPDQNMYDAMNKAVRFAHGAWIIFINSGDRFAHASVLSEVFSVNRDDFDLIYGNSLIEYKNGRQRLLKVNNNKAFWKRYINHQSSLIKTSVLKNRPFNTYYDLCSDFDFLMHMQQEKKNILPLDLVISVRSTGGKSDVNRIRAHKQKAGILQKLNNPELSLCSIRLYTAIAISREYLKTAIKFLCRITR